MYLSIIKLMVEKAECVHAIARSIADKLQFSRESTKQFICNMIPGLREHIENMIKTNVDKMLEKYKNQDIISLIYSETYDFSNIKNIKNVKIPEQSLCCIINCANSTCIFYPTCAIEINLEFNEWTNYISKHSVIPEILLICKTMNSVYNHGITDYQMISDSLKQYFIPSTDKLYNKIATKISYDLEQYKTKCNELEKDNDELRNKIYELENTIYKYEQIHNKFMSDINNVNPCPIQTDED